MKKPPTAGWAVGLSCGADGEAYVMVTTTSPTVSLTPDFAEAMAEQLQLMANTAKASNAKIDAGSAA